MKLTIRRVPTVVSNYQEDADKPRAGCGRNCLGQCCLPGQPPTRPPFPFLSICFRRSNQIPRRFRPKSGCKFSVASLWIGILPFFSKKKNYHGHLCLIRELCAPQSWEIFQQNSHSSVLFLFLYVLFYFYLPLWLNIITAAGFGLNNWHFPNLQLYWIK